MRRIYLDNAASRPVRAEVIEAMKPFFSEKFGNASSLHSFGREAKEWLEKSREKIASLVKCKPEELYFTSGGTESNNFALKGLFFANNKKHIITTSIEHDCILNTCRWLEKQGAEVTYLPVDKYGIVDLDALEKSIRKDTLVVSIIHANNEIGTIQDLKEIGKICKEKGVLFHSDACQSFIKTEVNVKKFNLDLMTINSHKIYGPKGVGALYIREGVNIAPLLHGGGHERGKRSSTENVAGIVGFAKAAELGCAEMETEMARQRKLRDYMIEEVLKIEDSWLNGHREKRLADNGNFCFRYIEGESLVLYLDRAGIAVSTGSACSSTSLEPSHVLLALGLKPEDAHGSIRVSMGRYTKREDIEYFLEVLPKTVERLREISPFKK